MSDHEMTFSKMPLDRCSSLRKDKNWLLNQVKSKNSIFIPIWRGNYFFVENKLLQLNYHELELSAENLTRKPFIFLGLEDRLSSQGNYAFFVIDCSEYQEESLATYLLKIVSLLSFENL